MRALRVVILCGALAACSQNQVSTAAEPASRSEWTSTLMQASSEVSAGRYTVADRVLVDFATRNPASTDAAEAIYWRALYRLDPANPNASSREAITLLDNYVNVAGATHRGEAMALRRIANALESRNSTPGNTAAVAKPADAPNDKAKDDEIQRLKDELAKSNAELERIKRRLAQPKP